MKIIIRKKKKKLNVDILYYYDDKEIEWIEIDENKELKIEYKR